MIKIMWKKTFRAVEALVVQLAEERDHWRKHSEDSMKFSKINAERAERHMLAYDVLLAADKEDPVRLAQVIAQWDSGQQAAFFNELAAAPVKLAWKYPFSDALAPDGEGQWYHVAQDLDEQGIKMMTDFAHFIEHRNDT